MPKSRLARFVLTRELELLDQTQLSKHETLLTTKKRSKGEVCPRCATFSMSYYDRRQVVVRDLPIRGFGIFIKVLKHRYWCKTCRKPFTEPVQGILPKRRTTQRYRRGVF